MDPIQELGKFLTPITEAKPLLDEVSTPFYERGYIRPIQCRWAIDKLEDLEKHVQNFCAYFDRTDHMPIISTALRYRPLLILRGMQQQITMLIGNLEDHLVASMAPSEQLLQQRKVIQEGFEKLLQYISDMPRQIQVFNDEVRFHQRRLVAMLND